VEWDAEGIITEKSLINIFDKRNSIWGIRRKLKEFRNKRRICYENQAEYKKILLFYHNQIEWMREDNLEYIA
jgi:hypothetical protein